VGKRRPYGRNVIIGLVFLAIGFGKLCFSWGPTNRIETVFPGSISGLALVLAIIFFAVAIVQIRRGQVEAAEKAY